MKAYVESKGGTLNIPEGGKELSEQELASVDGGLTDAEQMALDIGISTIPAVAAVAAVAAATRRTCPPPGPTTAPAVLTPSHSSPS